MTACAVARRMWQSGLSSCLSGACIPLGSIGWVCQVAISVIDPVPSMQSTLLKVVFVFERVFRAGFKKGDAKGKPNPLWSAGPMTLCWGFTKTRPMGRPKPEIDFASVTMPGEMPMFSNENNVLVRPQPGCTPSIPKSAPIGCGRAKFVQRWVLAAIPTEKSIIGCN